MRIRRHQSHHDSPEDLPLLDESAVVTDVAAMDHNRVDEVLAALRTTLEEYGTRAWERDRPADDDACETWLGRELDAADHVDGGTPLDGYLREPYRSGPPAARLDALQARYLQPYPSLLRVRVETGRPVEFLPGQYLSLRYEGTTRVYSVASSPARDYLEFAIRRVPGGDLTGDVAVDLEAGDAVELRGPYGDLLLEDPSPRDRVFLATGTGVAPFKSMLDFLFETGEDQYEGTARDVWLFLGAGWEDMLPYREAFREHAAERDNFHFVPTLSRESALSDWSGETAYVQHTLVKYLSADALDGLTLPGEFERYRGETPAVPTDARIDPGRAEVYACGQDAMVDGLVEAARRLGVDPDHTQFEGFG